MKIIIVNFFFCLLFAFFLYFGSSRSLSLKDKFYSRVTFVIIVLLHTFVEPDSLPDIEIYKRVFDRLAPSSITAVFTDIDDSGYAENFDVGYKLILSVVGKIWHNISFFLFLNSIALCLLYYTFFKKYSPIFALSVLLFLLIPYNQSLFVLRQHLSVAILLLSYKYVLERNIIKFSLIIFIASMIHFSSVIFVPVYFLYGIENRRRLMLLFIASVIMCVAIRVVLPLIAIVMAGSDRYGGYVADAEVGIASRGVIMLTMLLLYCWSLKGRIFDKGINRLVLIISLWGTLIALTIGNAGAGRIFLCYNVILTIQIPITALYIRQKSFRNLYIFSTIIALAVFAYLLSVDSGLLVEMKYLF